MDSATGSPHNKVKEEVIIFLHVLKLIAESMLCVQRYDPAVNFDADTDATDDVLNNQCSSVRLHMQC